MNCLSGTEAPPAVQTDLILAVPGVDITVSGLLKAESIVTAETAAAKGRGGAPCLGPPRCVRVPTGGQQVRSQSD
jgi:hypothetical protein